MLVCIMTMTAKSMSRRPFSNYVLGILWSTWHGGLGSVRNSVQAVQKKKPCLEIEKMTSLILNLHIRVAQILPNFAQGHIINYKITKGFISWMPTVPPGDKTEN